MKAFVSKETVLPLRRGSETEIFHELSEGSDFHRKKGF